MKKTGFLSTFSLFAALGLIFGPASYCQDFQRSGYLYYNCVLPTFFDFSWISDSCLNKTCLDYFLKDSSAKDLTFGFDSLRAPFGIYSFGHRALTSFYDTLAHAVTGGPYTVPDSVYVKKAKYNPQDLYLVKTGEGGQALFSETDNFYGGCYKLNFFWALDQAGIASVRPGAPVSAPLFRVCSAGGRNIVLEYSLSMPGGVTLEMYSASGRRVLTMTSAHACAGNFTMPLKLPEVPGGVYFLRFSEGKQSETQKIPVY